MIIPTPTELGQHLIEHDKLERSSPSGTIAATLLKHITMHLVGLKFVGNPGRICFVDLHELFLHVYNPQHTSEALKTTQLQLLAHGWECKFTGLLAAELTPIRTNPQLPPERDI